MSSYSPRLLLATEHSEQDAGADALALSLARALRVPLAVVTPLASNAEYEAIAPQRAAQAESDLAARRAAYAAAAGEVRLSVDVRRGDDAAAGIVAAAHDHGADLLLIRRRGRRGLIAQLLIGEMVSQVLTNAPCSVVVVPRDVRRVAGSVLAVIDPASGQASMTTQAAALAAALGLPLVSSSAEARSGEQIVAAAQRANAGLIVVQRQIARSFGRAHLAGSVAQLIGLSPLPVLVHVQPPAAAPH